MAERNSDHFREAIREAERKASASRDVVPVPSHLFTSPQPEQTSQQNIDPQALQAVIGLLAGNLFGNSPAGQGARAELEAGGPHQLTAAPTRELMSGESAPRTITVRSERVPIAMRAPAQTPEDRGGFRDMLSRHKKIRNIGAGTLVVAAAITGTYEATGWTVTDAWHAGLTVVGVGESSDLTFKSLDCKTELETAEIDSKADVAWKVNLAKPVDIAKNKKDPKYKIPTTPGELPPYTLPETPFSTGKMVERLPKIGLKQEVSIIGCDSEDEAFHLQGNTGVEVDMSKINLKAVTGKPPELDNYERFELKSNPALAATSPYTAAEIARLNKAISKNPGLVGEFKSGVLDELNEDKCAIDVRTIAKQAITIMLERQAADQGKPHVVVTFKNGTDFKMPGESYRADVPAVKRTSTDATIKNPQINCGKVALAEGLKK